MSMRANAIAYIVVLLTGAVLAGCAATTTVSQTEPVRPLNAQHGVALKGYDPVAYFADGRARRGSEQFAYSWHGVTWRFATEEHRAAFVADPNRYAPQYGGYCAYAISRGYIADIDPDSWAVEGGRLYLNNNVVAQQLWNRDRPGNIAAGDHNWPLVPKLPEAGS